jgi:hypothetical protein
MSSGKHKPSVPFKSTDNTNYNSCSKTSTPNISSNQLSGSSKHQSSHPSSQSTPFKPSFKPAKPQPLSSSSHHSTPLISSSSSSSNCSSSTSSLPTVVPPSNNVFAYLNALQQYMNNAAMANNVSFNPNGSFDTDFHTNSNPNPTNTASNGSSIKPRQQNVHVNSSGNVSKKLKRVDDLNQSSGTLETPLDLSMKTQPFHSQSASKQQSANSQQMGSSSRRSSLSSSDQPDSAAFKKQSAEFSFKSEPATRHESRKSANNQNWVFFIFLSLLPILK